MIALAPILSHLGHALVKTRQSIGREAVTIRCYFMRADYVRVFRREA